MASNVATPLERQFSLIPGISQMTSVSSLGSTSITLQFELTQNIIIPRKQEIQFDISEENGELFAAELEAPAAVIKARVIRARLVANA